MNLFRPNFVGKLDRANNNMWQVNMTTCTSFSVENKGYPQVILWTGWKFVGIYFVIVASLCNVYSPESRFLVGRHRHFFHLRTRKLTRAFGSGPNLRIPLSQPLRTFLLSAVSGANTFWKNDIHTNTLPHLLSSDFCLSCFVCFFTLAWLISTHRIQVTVGFMLKGIR